MSTPVVIERGARPPLHRYVLALLAVAAARRIGKLPPARMCRVLRVLARGARPATAARTLLARQDVVSVSIRLAGEECVPRSIATALLCRLGGSWPTWRTGVRTGPFSAHAWVEAEGGPVGEGPGVASFRPILTVAAGEAPDEDER